MSVSLSVVSGASLNMSQTAYYFFLKSCKKLEIDKLMKIKMGRVLKNLKRGIGRLVSEIGSFLGIFLEIAG